MIIGVGSGTINFTEDILPIESFCGIHDLPKINAIYFELNEEKMALISIEIVMLHDDFIEKCKKAVSFVLDVPENNVWIHVTHAITTPHAPGGPLIGLGGVAVDLTEEQANKRKEEAAKKRYYEDIIFVALIDALKGCTNRAEANVFVGTGEVDLIRGRDIKTEKGWWIGKSNKDDSNETMTIISLRNSACQVIAGIVSYGMKPCVIDNSERDRETRLITTDAPGLMCRLLEKELNCPMLYLTAAAGDRIPKEVALYDQIDEHGDISTVDLGIHKGLEIANSFAEIMAKSAQSIIANSEKISIQEIICKSSNFKWPEKEKTELFPRTNIEYKVKGEKSVAVDVFQLGEICLVAGKPEINVITESQLKEKSDFKHTLYVSMVNGGMKYMPDYKSYDEIHWEALASMLMPGAAEKFVEKAIELMNS